MRWAQVRPWLAWAVLVFLMIAEAGVQFVFQRNLTFFVDEWQLLVERRRWDLDTFLLPLYEHLFLVPVAVFKFLMLATGIGPRWAYALPLIALHLTCVVLVYLLARLRLGPWFALAPAVLILFLGSATDDLLLPIQVSFLGGPSLPVWACCSRSTVPRLAGVTVLPVSCLRLRSPVRASASPSWRRGSSRSCRSRGGSGESGSSSCRSCCTRRGSSPTDRKVSSKAAIYAETYRSCRLT